MGFIEANQYLEDKEKFCALVSKFTGISKNKLTAFTKEHIVKYIFEHPGSMDITPTQFDKISQLKDLHNLLNTMELSTDEKYTLNSSVKAISYMSNYFGNMKDKERFVCTFLNNAMDVIATKVISEGTINEAVVHPREIVKTALMYDASSVLLGHNHPGESLTASSSDISTTNVIKLALNTVNIKVVDHIICASNNRAFSFAEKGMLDNLQVQDASRSFSESGIASKVTAAKEKSVAYNYSNAASLNSFKGEEIR